jgi:hypothetical protein
MIRHWRPQVLGAALVRALPEAGAERAVAVVFPRRRHVKLPVRLTADSRLTSLDGPLRPATALARILPQAVVLVAARIGWSGRLSPKCYPSHRDLRNLLDTTLDIFPKVGEGGAIRELSVKGITT